MGHRQEPGALVLQQSVARTIRSGVAALAEVCRREFGVPSRIANVERARA
jgi:2-aminoadipate transaminase